MRKKYLSPFISEIDLEDVLTGSVSYENDNIHSGGGGDDGHDSQTPDDEVDF